MGRNFFLRRFWSKIPHVLLDEGFIVHSYLWALKKSFSFNTWLGPRYAVDYNSINIQFMIGPWALRRDFFFFNIFFCQEKFFSHQLKKKKKPSFLKLRSCHNFVGHPIHFILLLPIDFIHNFLKIKLIDKRAKTCIRVTIWIRFKIALSVGMILNIKGTIQ